MEHYIVMHDTKKRNNEIVSSAAPASATTYIVPALARHASAGVYKDAIVAVCVDLLHLFDKFGLGNLGDCRLRRWGAWRSETFKGRIRINIRM